MVGAGWRMRRSEGRRGRVVRQQGRVWNERSGQDRRQVAAAMCGMRQGVQQVGSLFVRPCVVMIVRVQRLRMVRAAATELMQIADRCEDRICQHREHQQSQRGKAQQFAETVGGDSDHGGSMLRDTSPVKQLQHTSWLPETWNG